jgi:DNA-binding NarL/FixJ family response regulator
MEAEKPAGRSEVRLIIVDDSKVFREGMDSLLVGERDIRIVGRAADGFEAIEVVSKTQADVVLMDIRMPGMNGIEATAKIKAEHPEVKVLGFSTHSEWSFRQAMKDAGADGFMAKDCRFDELLAAIRMVAHGREGFPDARQARG